MITALSLSPAVDKIYFVDDFMPGELYRVRNVIKSAGGKGINVARVSSMLGETVGALGFKAGESGEWLERKLKELKVDTNFISVEGESRTNNNIIDRVNKTETEVLEVGPFIGQDDTERFIGIFKEQLRKTSVAVCSGGLPEGVPVDFYARLISIAKACGVRVILDSSNETLSVGIDAGPYLIKPNLRELSKYAGKELKAISEIAEACRGILKKGVEVVVASLGGQGALLITGDIELHAKVPQVEVVNTIGSGDSMVAGFAAGLSRGLPIDEVLRLGTACALTNTQFMEIGCISMELVEKFIDMIIIERI